jgi:hypothetical protein
VKPEYLHLIPESTPPPLDGRPLRAVLIADQSASDSWREQIADWLVAGNCLYFIAWGVACEAWHDEVDWAVLEANGYRDIPDDRFVMTTWHDKDPLSEALWFAGNCAEHPDVDLEKTVILHLAYDDQRDRILHAFQAAQDTIDP